MENLCSSTWHNRSSPHLLNTPLYGGKPILWLCAASSCYQTFCWPWTASVLWGLFFFFLFLLLLIFSPHINYTDVLGAMCFATSQRKPQDFRSEELPDVLAWQNTTPGSRLWLPDQAGCLGKTGWGHHLLPENGTAEETSSGQTHSKFFFFFWVFFPWVDVLTTRIS